MVKCWHFNPTTAIHHLNQHVRGGWKAEREPVLTYMFRPNQFSPGNYTYCDSWANTTYEHRRQNFEAKSPNDLVVHSSESRGFIVLLRMLLDSLKWRKCQVCLPAWLSEQLLAALPCYALLFRYRNRSMLLHSMDCNSSQPRWNFEHTWRVSYDKTGRLDEMLLFS